MKNSTSNYLIEILTLIIRVNNFVRVDETPLIITLN